jgi:hypothetical protein
MKKLLIVLSLMVVSVAHADISPNKVALCKVKSFDSSNVTLACGSKFIKAPKTRLKAEKLKEGEVVGVNLDAAEWTKFQKNKILTVK